MQHLPSLPSSEWQRIRLRLFLVTARGRRMLQVWKSTAEEEATDVPTHSRAVGLDYLKSCLLSQAIPWILTCRFRLPARGANSLGKPQLLKISATFPLWNASCCSSLPLTHHLCLKGQGLLQAPAWPHHFRVQVLCSTLSLLLHSHFTTLRPGCLLYLYWQLQMALSQRWQVLHHSWSAQVGSVHVLTLQ